ncbi:GTPase activating protein (GAP) for Rho1p [Marasmius crinis-equi]|uniref:GTPase activating protein (GAP) for Rho1p n=1 Tax=Marasmius crinis-equi TaxID=585013 RepID=A0ABR3FDA0_9AGAR
MILPVCSDGTSLKCLFVILFPNQEPVIPCDLYHDFRDAIVKEPFDQEEVILNYKHLIWGMPRPNKDLLLYVLALLSMFARNSDKNLMPVTTLAAIFRPGLISHPSHETALEEHRLSQRVLEFLIVEQDWFLLDIPGPPQDETVLLTTTSSTSSDAGTQRHESRPVVEPDLSLVNKDQPVGGESSAGVTRTRSLPSKWRDGSSSTDGGKGTAF